MKILKAIAFLAVGMCVSGDSWADNEIGMACHGKHKAQAACNRDSKCSWKASPGVCVARCGTLAADVCAKEKRSCSVALGNRCAQKA